MKANFLKSLSLASLLALGFAASGCGTNSGGALPLPPAPITVTQDFMIIPNANNGNVTLRSVDDESGIPTHQESVSSGGAEPAVVKTHPTRPIAFVANRTGASISTIALNINENLFEFGPIPASPVAAPTLVTSLTIHPNGRFLYAAGSTSVQAYSIGDDGSLTAVGASIPLPQGAGLHGAFTAQGSFLHLPLLASIQSFTINGDTGELTLGANTPIADAAVVGQLITVSGDLFLAVADLAGDATGRVIAFAPNNNNDLVQQSLSPLTVDPAGATLSNGRIFIGDASEGEISVFGVNPGNGVLTAIDGSPFTVAGGGVAPKIDSNGRFLYSVNEAGDSIGVQTIGGDGALTPIADSPFVDNLNGARFFDFMTLTFTF